MANSPSDVSLKIGAVDNTSATIARINASLGSLAKPTKQAGVNLTSAFDADKLRKVSDGFRDMSFHLRDVLKQTLSLGPAIGALTAAGTLAGVYRMADAFGTLGIKLQNVAQRAGIPVKSLQDLQKTVQLGGGDPNAVGGALATLHDHMTGARDGTDPEAIKWLNTLGMFNSKDMNAPTAETFEKLRGKLATLWKRDPTYAGRVGEGLLGGDYGAIQPAVTRQRPDWDRYKKEAAASPDLDDDDTKKADTLREHLVLLQQSFSGLGTTILKDVAQPLTEVVSEFNKLIESNKDGIGQGARDFAEWLKNSLPDIIKNTESFASEIEKLVTALGGWKSVTEDILALWAGAKFLGVIKTMRGLAGALGPGSGGGSGAIPGGGQGMLGWLGMMSAWKVAFDVVTGNSPVPSNETFEKNNLGHGWFQNFFDRMRGGGGVSQPAPTTEQQQRIAQGMGKQLLGLGLTREGAAAVIGSGVDTESGFNPHPPETAYNAGHAGHFQWDATRQARIAQRFGKSVNDMNSAEQLSAAMWEAQTYYPGVWKAIHGHDIGAANKAWTEQFESPGNYSSETPNRLAKSQRDLAYVPQAAPDLPAGPSSNSGSSGGSGPSGTGRIHITTDDNGKTRVNVIQQGDNFTLEPLPSRKAMSSSQGG